MRGEKKVIIIGIHGTCCLIAPSVFKSSWVFGVQKYFKNTQSLLIANCFTPVDGTILGPGTKKAPSSPIFFFFFFLRNLNCIKVFCLIFRSVVSKEEEECKMIHGFRHQKGKEHLKCNVTIKNFFKKKKERKAGSCFLIVLIATESE